MSGLPHAHLVSATGSLPAACTDPCRGARASECSVSGLLCTGCKASVTCTVVLGNCCPLFGRGYSESAQGS